MIAEVDTEAVQTSLKHISRKQTHLTNKITTHVNKLIEAINQVWGKVEAETHGDDPTDTLEIPILFPPLKVDLVVHVLEIGTQEFDDVSHELGT